MDNTKEIVAKINDLYILKRKKWIKLSTLGNYSMMEYPRDPMIIDFVLESHLKGFFTVNVFSGMKISKFLCFDVDEKDNIFARWKVQKLIDSMNNLGIHQKYIATSFSGNKGYHVELFFDKLMALSEVRKFYEIIISDSELDETVEFRPTGTQSIKIPLGWNYNNKNMMENECCFVDPFNYFKPFSREYIFNTEKVESNLILDIIENFYSVDSEIISDPVIYSYASNSAWKDDKELIHNNIQPYNPVEIKDLIAEKETIGIKAKGTRHNILKDLTLLYKNGLGLDQNDNKKRLIEFMEKQNPNNYSTPWKEVIREIETLVEYNYKYDYQLPRYYRFNDPQFSISDKDVERILEVKSKNGKLLLCSLLVHCKKYANSEGMFFMTFEQMTKSSKLSYSTCYRQIQYLSDNNFIEIVRCNRKRDGTYLKYPNSYKLINFDSSFDKSIDVVGSEDSKVILNRAFSLVDDCTLKGKLSKEDYYRLKRGEYL